MKIDEYTPFLRFFKSFGKNDNEIESMLDKKARTLEFVNFSFQTMQAVFKNLS